MRTRAIDITHVLTGWAGVLMGGSCAAVARRWSLPRVFGVLGGLGVSIGACLPWMSLYAGLVPLRGLIGLNGRLLLAAGVLGVALGVVLALDNPRCKPRCVSSSCRRARELRNRGAPRSPKALEDQMNQFVRTMAVVAVAATLISCGGVGSSITGITGGSGGTGGTSNNQVCSGSNFCMGSATFFPDSITVTSGSTVTWNNSSGITHNVTFDNPSAAGAVTGGSSGNIPDHASGMNSRVFRIAGLAMTGLVRFHCTIHGTRMHGTILVQ
jgi:plastocyanin